MRATPLAAPVSPPSRKKPLKLDDDLDTQCPPQKQARSGPQPRLPPCPPPLSPPPAPVRAPAVTTASRLGPYVLLEPEEGGRAYRAVHCPTGTEYTCQVSAPRGPRPASQGPGKSRGYRGLSGLRDPCIHLVLCLLGRQPVSPPTLCQAPGWTVTREVNQMVPALGIHSLGPHNGYRLQGWSLGTMRAEGKSL